MAQFARPDSNITQTAFTGGFADIDEVTASDTDRAFSTDGSDAELEVGLSNVTDPAVSTGHTFRYRVAKTDDGTASGTGNAKTVIVRLMQGATVIATDTERTLTGSYTTYSRTLTGTEADAITNYSDLRLEFATLGGGGSPSNRRGVGVSWAELEVPDEPDQWDQVGFRGRNDDGSESGATWKAAENTGWTQSPDETFRLRFALNKTAGSNTSAGTHRLKYRYSTDGSIWTDWAYIATTATHIKPTTSLWVTQGQSTSNQIGGTGTFRASRIVEDPNNTSQPNTSVAAGEHTEFEFVLTIPSGAVAAGALIEVKADNALADLAAYTVSVATIQIAGPGNATADLQTLAVSVFDAIATGGGGPTLVQQQEAGAVATSVGVGITPAAGNKLIAFVANNSGSTNPFTVADDAGNTWTFLEEGFETGITNTRVEVWVADNVNGVATTVTASTSSATACQIMVQEWSGLAAVAESLGGGTASTTSFATGSVTVPTGGVVLSAINHSTSSGAFSDEPTGWVDDGIAPVASNVGLHAAHLLTSGSQSATWTLTPARAAGWLIVAFNPAASDGSAVANAVLQSIAGSLLAASATGAAGTTADLQSLVGSLLAASAGGQGRAAGDLQALAASVLGATAAGGASVTTGLVGASTSILTATPSGKAQTTAALLSVPASLLGAEAHGGGAATADLLLTVTSPLAAEAVGKALAQADLLALGVTPFAASAGVIARVEAALQTMTGSVLTVDATGAAAASAVMQSVAMTLLASGATGAAQADAALLATSAAVLASEARGGGFFGSDLLTASVAVLEALAVGSALANAPVVSAQFSIFQPNVMAGGSATASADLVSLSLTALDPTPTAGAKAVADLLAAAWAVHSVTVGGGAAAQANADLLLMALSQFAGSGAGGALVVPGLLGTEVSTFAVQSRGAAQVTADLQSANWSLFDASAGGAQSAIANAALLVVGMVLNDHVATGKAIGVAGVAGLVSEALDAVATGAGFADAGAVSLSVTVLDATAGEVIRNFEGTATATLSLTARGSVSLSLVGEGSAPLSLDATESLEVAA